MQTTVYNERTWNGHVISWIHELINEGRTSFQDATNDTGITVDDGTTKFPDVLLFQDKISGIIFNGWELKFPDTKVDDSIMLENAIEKARRIGANSFVTWNGPDTIIWKIENSCYNIDSLTRLKEYSNIRSITLRSDLSNPHNYNNHIPELKNRLLEILHDLEQFSDDGIIRNAITVSDNIISSIQTASRIIIPHFQNEIDRIKNLDRNFREEFNKWRIYEDSTIRILNSSSRRAENESPQKILAKFTFYNLIGKLIFYMTLSENFSGRLNRINIENKTNLKRDLDNYFSLASDIDYAAVFKPYFTDVIEFSEIVKEALFNLLTEFGEFDFRILPTTVIGEILENLVPKEEKQKFGQYFTSDVLASLVIFPAIDNSESLIFDPTCGTGTFLNSAYKIFNYFGNTVHHQLLNQIWGNDISHFPAILSVINLYKQDVTKTNNFPRVLREDFFSLFPNTVKRFPSTNNFEKVEEISIPSFDAIVSNFPFIQQEDIPNDILTKHFRTEFEQSQQAFLTDASFKINERSDYFTYCIYNSLRFLKEGGYISAITSNAWLGKEYGAQFKKFLLDNFHIKYIVKSSVEHWFSDSKVSTIYFVLQKTSNNLPTKFVTLNTALENLFSLEEESIISKIEDFYSEVDNCEDPNNNNWSLDRAFNNLYHNTDNSISVSIIARTILENSITTQTNWSQFFISANIFDAIDQHLIRLYPTEIKVFRGERTGWNDMFVIPNRLVDEAGIENNFLIPYLKSSKELKNIRFEQNFNHYLFSCGLPIEELEKKYPGAYNWIRRFKDVRNKNSSMTIEEACSNHRPFWYSLRPKRANIVTSINPFKRLFFSFSETDFTIDQRLAAINVDEENDVKIIVALLNSVYSLLALELHGVSRNLGALDINANYLKSILSLNHHNLTDIQKDEIVDLFDQLSNREVHEIFDEVKKEDRIIFDRTVLRAFDLDENILPKLYERLTSLVSERVYKKER